MFLCADNHGILLLRWKFIKFNQQWITAVVLEIEQITMTLVVIACTCMCINQNSIHSVITLLLLFSSGLHVILCECIIIIILHVFVSNFKLSNKRNAINSRTKDLGSNHQFCYFCIPDFQQISSIFKDVSLNVYIHIIMHLVMTYNWGSYLSINITQNGRKL